MYAIPHRGTRWRNSHVASDESIGEDVFRITTAAHVSFHSSGHRIKERYFAGVDSRVRAGRKQSNIRKRKGNLPSSENRRSSRSGRQRWLLFEAVFAQASYRIEWFEPDFCSARNLGYVGLSELRQAKVHDGLIRDRHGVIARWHLDRTDIGIPFSKRTSGEICLVGALENCRLIVLDVRIIGGQNQCQIAACVSAENPQLSVSATNTVGIIDVEYQRPVRIDSKRCVWSGSWQLLD